jgi:N-acetylmuramoyl-L-alanine amidase
MRQVLWAFVACILCCAPMTKAQSLSGLARIDASRSYVQDHNWRQVEIQLTISQSVPYRIYQLNNPMRLIVEFNEVVFDGLNGENFDQSKRVSNVEFGSLGTGWSRLAMELTEPLGLKTAEMIHDQQAGNSVLTIWTGPVTEQEFVQTSGVPMAYGVKQSFKDVLFAKGQDKDAQILIVLDPGHGGADPGAVVGGVKEADLMLLLALELKEALLRTQGIEVALTRTDDTYPTLAERLRFTNLKKADLFVSLHADTVTEGVAKGTTIYTLSEQASDKTSAQLAQEHDRVELLVGLNLRGTEDRIADVLIDLARQDNIPRSEALAQTTIQELLQVIGLVNAKPLRHANFSVLKSPDVPSILIEVGFMSTKSDLENLLDKKWRENFVLGVRNGIIKWVGEDSIVAPLRRQ